MTTASGGTNIIFLEMTKRLKIIKSKNVCNLFWIYVVILPQTTASYALNVHHDHTLNKHLQLLLRIYNIRHKIGHDVDKARKQRYVLFYYIPNILLQIQHLVADIC